MKINNVIRLAYTNSEPLYRRLADDVKERLKISVESNGWFFIYRVKALESFAMKMETGRVADPNNLDDFFACMVVVPTIGDISDAENLIYEHYESVGRKPLDSNQTRKRASSFEFDDLRLYVKRRPVMTGSSEDLDELVFEIQVKTILQYAWSVATHDLIYKTDSVSWTKERIAFQVKAMLEHAELAISEASNLASASGFQKQDDRTKEITALISLIQVIWPEDLLPRDMKRLAENISSIVRTVGVDVVTLERILRNEIIRNEILPSDLSPYAFIVQALAHSDELDLQAKLKANKRTRLLIHSGMDLPAWCNAHPQCIVIGKK